MPVVIHWYCRLLAIGWLGVEFLCAGRYFRRYALSDLDLPASQSLDARVFRRWRHYVYGVAYLSAVFGLLHRRLPDRNDRRLSGRLAALACFFDDLVDTFPDRDRSGKPWQDNPERYGQVADPSGLALHLLSTVYRSLPETDLAAIKQLINRVFNVETAGRQIETTDTTLDKLARITAEKGGCSVLLFRRALNLPLQDTEQLALYEFGYLVQLCDDIFDVWFDRQAGTHTLATLLTRQNDLPQLARRFEQQVALTARAFRAMPYPARRIETAWAGVRVLVSSTRVCLKQYGQLQKKHGALPLDDRSAMVVDMALWKNWWLAAWELVGGDVGSDGDWA